MGILAREMSLSHLWLQRNTGSCWRDAVGRSEIGGRESSLELTAEVLVKGDESLNKGSKSAPEGINSKDI